MNTAMDVNKALATCARRTAGTAAYRAGYGNTELVVGFAAGVIGGGVEGSGATTVGGSDVLHRHKAVVGRNQHRGQRDVIVPGPHRNRHSHRLTGVEQARRSGGGVDPVIGVKKCLQRPGVATFGKCREIVAGCAAGREQQVIRRAMAGHQEWCEAFTYGQVGNRHIVGHAVCAVGPGRKRGGRHGCADNE